MDRPLDPRDGRLRANLKPARRQQQRLRGLAFVGKRNAPDSAEAIHVDAQDEALDSLGRQ
jgi:hypothetical protein